jgi:hypothetical protein
VIRYEPVDHDDARILADPRVSALEALGFRRAGGYVGRDPAGQQITEGELFVDAKASTAIALCRYTPPGSGHPIVTASMQSELEDGTLVTTEERPETRWWLFGPGATLPVAGSSLRFPDVSTVAELVDQHAAHVEEVRQGRGGAELRGGTSVPRYCEARHEHQRRKAPIFAVRKLVGMLSGVVVFVLGFAGSAWLRSGNATAGRLAVVATVGLAFAAVVGGSELLAPFLIRARLLRPNASVAPTVARRGVEGLEIVVARPAWQPLAVAALSVVGVLVAALALKNPWQATVAAYPAALIVEAFVTRSQRGGQKAQGTIGVDGGVLRAPGGVEIPVDEVRAAIEVRTDPPTLTLLDAAGRVVLTARGSADEIATLSRVVGVERHALPLNDATFQRAHLPAVLTVALAVLLRAQPWTSPAIVLLAVLASVWPLGRMFSRARIEVGVDGLGIVSTIGREVYLAFTDIASIQVQGEAVTITDKKGGTTSRTFRHAGSGSLLARAWQAHQQREASRDPALAERRRVALEPTVPEASAYRVAVEDAEVLADAALDSTESQSVRVRAARRLTVDRSAEAARARARVQARVADPVVRKALGPGSDAADR